VNLGDMLFQQLIDYTAKNVPHFTHLFAQYYFQVGVKDISASGDYPFHSVFYPDHAQPAGSIIVGGTSHDVKFLELASALFSVGCANSPAETEIDKTKCFQNLTGTKDSIQACLDSTYVGAQGQEMQRLLCDVWIQDCYKSVHDNDMTRKYDDARWSQELREMWAIDPDTKKSSWLPMSQFRHWKENGSLPMMLLLALTKLFCCELCPPTKIYVGYEQMVKDGTDTRPLPGGTFVVTECAFSANGPGTIYVDSNVIDPDFAIDIWRPSTNKRVGRVAMPLVVGRNQRVVHDQSIQCQQGDVLGWSSPNEIDLKFKEGHGMRLTCNFPPGYGDKPQMSFDRAYSVSVLERSPYWDDVQAAVHDVLDDDVDVDVDQLFIIAKRTAFLDPSSQYDMSQLFNYELLKRSLNDESLQSLINENCQLKTTIETTEWHGPVDCQTSHGMVFGCHDKRTITAEYGKQVRGWISANQASFLRDVKVDSWKNVEHHEEKRPHRRGASAEQLQQLPRVGLGQTSGLKHVEDSQTTHERLAC
jgi:hypothetical protein